MEARLAQTAGDVAAARAMEQRLRNQLAGTISGAERNELLRRLEAAEAESSAAGANTAALTQRAEDAERQLKELRGSQQTALAELTHLRQALRELSSHSDASAAVGRAQQELEHARAKEAFARAALNRSELERLELERQARGGLRKHPTNTCIFCTMTCMVVCTSLAVQAGELGRFGSAVGRARPGALGGAYLPVTF